MRMRGTPWSEEEHTSFLRGLKAFGKGNWKDISRHFVVTRTPTQVASHAQKYFIRIQRKMRGDRKRKSVFDRAEEGTDENDPPPVPPPPAPVQEPVPSPLECAALQAAASFWMHVASQYHQTRFQIPTRTHEIRKPIPLRDASNVMQALLK